MTLRYLSLLLFLLSGSLISAQVHKFADGTSAFGGEHNSGAIYTVDFDEQDIPVIYHFDAMGPLAPYGAPLLASDGFFYGTTTEGGDHNRGTIFRIDHLGNEPEIIHHFNEPEASSPYCTLIEGVDGKLYGTTAAGGDHSLGTVFSLQKDGLGFSILHHFTGAEGSEALSGVTQGSDGMLYGTTTAGGIENSGTVYRVSTDGSTFELLHEFADLTEGSHCYSQLVEDTEGYFYGTLSSGGPDLAGSVFKIKNDGSEFSIIKSFGFSTDEGSSPYCSLILASDGKLYGTTFSGGTEYKGTVFSLATDGSDFSNVHSFVGMEGQWTFFNSRLSEHTDGYLYGTTIRGGIGGEGTIFKVNKEGDDFSVIGNFDGKNGGYAYAGLSKGPDDFFYGFTTLDDETRFGLFYKTNEDGSVFETVHDFTSANASGAIPFAGYSEASPRGITTYGGENGFGVIFGGSQVYHHFNEMDGKWPSGRLLYANNIYYGTCQAGGEHDRGTIFSINGGGDQFEVLYDFSELINDGASPRSGLILGSDGMLYGTSSSGGEFGQGSVFRISTDGSDYAQLASFDEITNGSSPNHRLVEAENGKLYGTTIFGGEISIGFPGGTLFSLNKDGSEFEVLHVFESSETGSPSGPLLEREGYLYGCTDFGAAYESGSVYRISLDGSDFEMIHEFMPSEGISPRGGLSIYESFFSDNEYLYGVTRGGGDYNHGTVFKIKCDGTEFETIISFSGSPDEPSEPNGDLYLDLLVNTKDANQLEGIALSPNPTSGEFKFIWEKDFPIEKNADLFILDEKGNMVFQMNGNLNEINSVLKSTTENWSNGNYFIQLNMDGKYFSETLILLR